MSENACGNDPVDFDEYRRDMAIYNLSVAVHDVVMQFNRDPERMLRHDWRIHNMRDRLNFLLTAMEA